MKIATRFPLGLVVLTIACSPETGSSSGSQLSVRSKTGPLPLDAPVEVGISAMRGSRLAEFVAEGLAEPVLMQRVPGLFAEAQPENSQTFAAILPSGLEGARGNLSPVASQTDRFRFEEQRGGRLLLLEENRPVLQYNYGFQMSQGVPEDRKRSSYVHPVYDLAGRILTDDFPKDHYHHRGLSWMWPKVVVNGEDYDLWHLRGVKQHFEKWLVRDVGPVCATLGVENLWKVGSRNVADERVWLRVFRAGEAGRAIDVRITWHARERLELRGADDRGYGGLCFRLGLRSRPVITTPRGRESEDSDLVPLPWADQSGHFVDSEEKSGVAIFQNSTNPGYPAGWCLRYYGFLGVSWPGLTTYTLERSDRLTLRFRIWIHVGDAFAGRVEEAYSVFSEPPLVAFADGD